MRFTHLMQWRIRALCCTCCCKRSRAASMAFLTRACATRDSTSAASCRREPCCCLCSSTRMNAPISDDRYDDEESRQSHAPEAVHCLQQLPSAMRHVAATSRVFFALLHRNPINDSRSKQLENPVCVELFSQLGGLTLPCPPMTPAAPAADRSA